MIRHRLAKYDKNGDPHFDTDVLTPEELAMDAGWITPGRYDSPLTEPGLAAIVARLQESAK